MDVLYERALIAWGTWAQCLVAIEEAGEFVQACSKVMRTPVGDVAPIDRLTEEMADLELMLDELKYIFGLKAGVDDWKLLKIDRLEGLLGR